MKRIMLNLLGVLAVGSALNFQLSTVYAQGASYSLLTITNPTPATGDSFGYSVAAVGTDRVLIGAPRDNTSVTFAGAAYLFSTNGALLTTFTNPTPVAYDSFGTSVSAVGTDRILIGAYQDNTGAEDSGAAYLFSTDGALLTTFTNPTPKAYDYFGISVAAVGTDWILIGANGGAPYLFNTNGVLLTTFTNPTPTSGNFGISVAAVGTDRILVGAPGPAGVGAAGTAYLFGANGALLTTFTNPTPANGDFFGSSVAAVGDDRVLIGAVHDDAGEAGAAYLFSTNGTLLATFTNPTPAYNDHFGTSVSAVGSDRVLIGEAAAFDAGAAYLFTTNGVLLTTFTNPTPAILDDFGFSVAAVGTDRVLIGAYLDDTGASNAGAVYLYSLPQQTPEVPSLTIRLTNTNTVAVSWLSPSTDWTLQENTNGGASVNWSNAPGTIQDNGATKTLIVNHPTGNRFYRLFKQ